MLVTPLAPSRCSSRRPPTPIVAWTPWRHRTGRPTPTIPVFLVTFFSDQPDVRFVPEEVQFVSRGIRARPETIHPLTPGWGSGRVAQRETELAVYVFDRARRSRVAISMLHYGL